MIVYHEWTYLSYVNVFPLSTLQPCTCPGQYRKKNLKTTRMGILDSPLDTSRHTVTESRNQAASQFFVFQKLSTRRAAALKISTSYLCRRNGIYFPVQYTISTSCLYYEWDYNNLQGNVSNMITNVTGIAKYRPRKNKTIPNLVVLYLNRPCSETCEQP